MPEVTFAARLSLNVLIRHTNSAMINEINEIISHNLGEFSSK